MTVQQVQTEMSMQDIVKEAYKLGFKAKSAKTENVKPTPSQVEQEAYEYLLLICDYDE